MTLQMISRKQKIGVTGTLDPFRLASYVSKLLLSQPADFDETWHE